MAARAILPLLISMLWLFEARAQATYEVLVNSRGTNAIHHFDAEGNWLGEFISAGSGGLVGPEDILFHPDGTVLVTGFGNTVIKRYDGLTGDYIDDFSSGYALETPSKMSIGPDSLIYVTQWGTVQQKVVRFDLDGAFVDEFTSVATPNGLGHFWDAQGRFYISVYGNGANGFVRRFTADGDDLGTFINSSVLQGPTDLWQVENGDIFVQDWTAGTVLRFDSVGAYLGVFVAGLTNPEGHAFLPDGSLLMGDWGVDAVHHIGAQGENLGYFADGNGLTDPNCVRLRSVQDIGFAESKAEASVLRVFPSVGSDRFDLVAGPGASAATVSVVGANGRVHAILSLNLGEGGMRRATWVPPGEMAAGLYRLLMVDERGVASTPVMLLR